MITAFLQSLTPTTLFLLVGWIVAGLAVGKLLYRDDRRLKALQREANDLAQTLATWGFKLLPPILTDFAILDFVSLAGDCRHAANVMKNPTTAAAELTDVMNKMVEHQLSNTSTAQSFFNDFYSKAIAKGLTVPTSSTPAAATK